MGGPLALLQAYMDDVRFSSCSCKDLVKQFHGLVILKKCTGLRVNMKKTVAFFLGHIDELAAIGSHAGLLEGTSFLLWGWTQWIGEKICLKFGKELLGLAQNLDF
eukprot:3875605-Amphidinium_carterae.2